MKLRKHQAAFFNLCTDIRLDREIKKVIISATPGGGKSLIPVIAAAKLIPALADKICWVVPRLALQEQGERAFMDPFFREQLNHKHQVRASTNEDNPSRGLSGYVTTYQAISQNSSLHAQAFTKHRYILVLDEPHHVEAEGIWHSALQPLVARAALVVLMSGTLERSSGKRIALESEATRSRSRDLSQSGPGLDYEENQMFLNFMKEFGIDGSPVQLKEELKALDQGDAKDVNSILTPRELEQQLRKSIEAYCRRYQNRKKLEHGYLNREMVRVFQKSRKDMTQLELERAMTWLKKHHPI